MTHIAFQDPLERARSRVGAVLSGKWRLDRVLGVGGMASVYAATHRNGSRGAVKLLHPELATDADTHGRFLREGLVANQVEHPGVVRVLDDDTDPVLGAYLVMDLLEGESVEAHAARFEGERLPEATVGQIGLDLCAVLAVAHAKGIVHRDIKPENLFLTRAGELRVLDFGIARIRDGVDSARATRAGTLMGTPAFMAPEQALGHVSAVDARSDVWSIGATLFTLLSGRIVHEDETSQKVLLAAMTRPARATRSVAPWVSEELARIVDRAMRFEREDRFADAGEMHTALAALVGAGASTTLLSEWSPARAPSRPSPVVVEGRQSSPSNAEPPGAGRGTQLTQAVTSPRAAPSSTTRRIVVVSAVTTIAACCVGWWFFALRHPVVDAPTAAHASVPRVPDPERATNGALPSSRVEPSFTAAPAPSSTSSGAAPSTTTSAHRTPRPPAASRPTATAESTAPPTLSSTAAATTPDFKGRF